MTKKNIDLYHITLTYSTGEYYNLYSRCKPYKRLIAKKMFNNFRNLYKDKEKKQFCEKERQFMVIF